MNQSMIARLEAVAAEQADRRDAMFQMFKQVLNVEGAVTGYVIINTGEEYSPAEFVDLVERQAESVFVPFDSGVKDEEQVAYWAEQEAQAPTWSDLQEENDWEGTWEELEAIRAERRGPYTEADIRRRELAKRFEKRMEAMEPFWEEMTARLNARRGWT